MKYKVISRTLHEDVINGAIRAFYVITIESMLPAGLCEKRFEIIELRRPVEVGKRMTVGSELSFIRPVTAFGNLKLNFGATGYLFPGQGGNFIVEGYACRLGCQPCDVHLDSISCDLKRKGYAFLDQLIIEDGEVFKPDLPVDLSRCSQLAIDTLLPKDKKFIIRGHYTKAKKLAGNKSDIFPIHFNFAGEGEGWIDMNDEEYIHV